jgi:hypothetical protein
LQQPVPFNHPMEKLIRSQLPDKLSQPRRRASRRPGNRAGRESIESSCRRLCLESRQQDAPMSVRRLFRVKQRTGKREKLSPVAWDGVQRMLQRV